MMRYFWDYVAIVSFVVIGAVLIFTTQVSAQETVVDIAPAINQALGYVAEVAVLIIVGLAIWLSRWVRDKIGIDLEARLLEIDARHRETLHSALITGARKGAEVAGIDLNEPITIDMRNKVVAEATRWAMGPGAHEAVEHFNLTPETVADMALIYIGADYVVADTEDPA